MSGTEWNHTRTRHKQTRQLRRTVNMIEQLILREHGFLAGETDEAKCDFHREVLLHLEGQRVYWEKHLPKEVTR